MTPGLRLLIRLRPVLRFVKYKVLHADDCPQRIARGIAIGLFTAYLPLLGLHMFLAATLAVICRANKAMAVVTVWISNPLTAVIIYYPAYRLGRFLLGFFRSGPAVESEQIERIFTETLTFSRILLDLFEPQLWKQIWQVCLAIGLELLVGGIILGLAAAIIGYRLSAKAVTVYRSRRRRRQKRRKPTRFDT